MIPQPLEAALGASLLAMLAFAGIRLWRRAGRRRKARWGREFREAVRDPRARIGGAGGGGRRSPRGLDLSLQEESVPFDWRARAAGLLVEDERCGGP